MHLVVDVSFHGLGHLAQTAPVVNALTRRLPALRLSIRCPAPLHALRGRIESVFGSCPYSSDQGIAMKSALEVDYAATRGAYRDFHADLDGHIGRYAEWLTDIGADAVLSNVAYVPLAAARRTGTRVLQDRGKRPICNRAGGTGASAFRIAPCRTVSRAPYRRIDPQVPPCRRAPGCLAAPRDARQRCRTSA